MRAAFAALAAALTILSAPSPAFARVVDYSLSPAAIIAGGQTLKMTPLTLELHPNMRLEKVATLPGADHITLALGQFCSAYKVENPISKLLESVKAEWNAAAEKAAKADAATPVSLTVNTASSYRRCVEIGEMNVRCITKVSMTGTITAATANGEAQSIPIAAEAERDASVGGFCGDLAKGVGVVGREAAIALFLDAERKLPAAQTVAQISPEPSSAIH